MYITASLSYLWTWQLLSHRRPASTREFYHSCCVQESNKRNTLYWIIFANEHNFETKLSNVESKSTLLNFFILKCHHISLLFVMMPLSALYQNRTFSSFHFACPYTKVIPTAECGNLQKDINLKHLYIYKQ